MATAKDCHAMTSYFEKLYKDKYGVKPNVNRNTARWGFDSVLKSMSTQQAKDLLEFYLKTTSERRHNLDWFFYNYDKLIDSMLDRKKDKTHIEQLMEESRRRAEEWRSRGKSSLSDN